MSQIIIIDVQDRFVNHKNISIDTSQLCQDLIEFCKSASSVLFILDSHEGEHLDFPEELYEFDPEGEEYTFDPQSYPHIFKQYGFFRSLMDSGVDSETIIGFGKWMIQNNIPDARDMEEDQELREKFFLAFKDTVLVDIDFNDYGFYIPTDLIEDLQTYVNQGCILAGGGLNECLKEISLLLKMIDIDHEINYSLTY